MNRGKWTIVLVLILLTASVSAEIFKYVDQDGNVLYTDDLSVIPAAQRSDIEVFSGTADQADATPENEVQEPTQTETTDADDSEELSVRLEKKQQELLREGEALEAERKALNKEKETLFSSRRFKSGTDSRITRQLRELNQKIAASNKKLEDYEKKKAAVEAEMKAIQGQ